MYDGNVVDKSTSIGVQTQANANSKMNAAAKN